MSLHDCSSVMSPESMTVFVEAQRSKGASENMLRRLKATVKMLYAFLPEDKSITRERLLAWRTDMSQRGYAAQTVQNYVKWINLYLDHVGLSALRFNRGKGKDITGVEFGFLTALSPTDKRDRKDIVWLCRCRCGNTVELTATRLLSNNTLSCGCIHTEVIRRANKYFGGTSLERSLREQVTCSRSKSGYVGVTKKRDKWQAYITYQGKRTSLGVYDKLEDAVKARARGKEAVMEDATKLLEIYNELHKNDAVLPSRATEAQKAIAHGEKRTARPHKNDLA